MRKYLAIILSLMLLLSACGKKQVGPTWQEQYDLGVRYLSEGNYEEAIIAFTAAIEIDQMNADAYLALAEVFVAQNNFDKAKEILENAYELLGDNKIKARIDELNSGSISDFWGNLRKTSYSDENGNILWTHVWDYDVSRKKTGITCYDSSGAIVVHLDYEYDSDGNKIVDSGGYSYEDGIFSREVNEYDDAGKLLKVTSYDMITGEMERFSTYSYADGEKYSRIDVYGPDAALIDYSLFAWDHAGNVVKMETYLADGTMDFYWIYSYDEDGQEIQWEGFNPDGTIYASQTHEYDSEGKRVKTVHYDAVGNIIGETTFD